MSMSATAARDMMSVASSPVANALISVLPDMPYNSDTPIKNMAVAAPPNTRYLSAASALSTRRYASNTNAYTGSDMSSRPRNMVRKLSAEMSRQTPYNDDRRSAGNSPPS